MKNMKKFAVGCIAVLTLVSASVTSFAASAYQTPAEAAAGVTGQSLEDVIAQRQSGKSYGSIAADAGKLSEFQQATREIQQDRLNAGVANGTITQEQADAWIAAMQERQSVCDGTGMGAGCGLGAGNCGLGAGMGLGQGQGRGQGRGMGLGLRDGSCLYQ